MGCLRLPLDPGGSDEPPPMRDAGHAADAGANHGGSGGRAGAGGRDGGGGGGLDAQRGADAVGNGGAGAAPDAGGPRDAGAAGASDAIVRQPDAGLVISFPAGSSVAYQVDVAHTGNQPASALTPPLAQAWAVDLGGRVSYPLVVDGRVFVTVGNTSAYGTKLEALDLTTGMPVWGPIDIGGTYYWSNAAYDAGRIYVINFDGLMTAFDAASGSTIWTRQMPGQYAFSSPPTAAGGMVFVGGAGVGGTVYGVDGATGQVLWTAGVENGDHSSPALSAGAVYVSYACVQADAFAPLDGTRLWHHNGGCEGGGGDTTVLYQGRLWARDWATSNLVLDAATGNEIASFSASAIPAFAGTRGFFLVGSTLQALDANTRTVLWTFPGDGMLASPPLVVNSRVYIGSSAGQLYAIDPATGDQTWSDKLAWGVSASDEFNVTGPLAGMGAGGDSLLVPADTHLVCYH